VAFAGFTPNEVALTMEQNVRAPFMTEDGETILMH